MTRYTFDVLTSPVTWKRARRNKGQYFTDKKQAAYQKTVANEAMASGVKLLNGPVSASIVFHLPIPLSRQKGRNKLVPGSWAHDCPKDADNLAKGVMDALNGVAFEDDRQVVSLSSIKVWSLEARAHITLSKLDA